MKPDNQSSSSTGKLLLPVSEKQISFWIAFLFLGAISLSKWRQIAPEVNIMESMDQKIVNKPRSSGMDHLGDSFAGIDMQRCDHTMEKLRHLGTDYQGDVIVIHFQCDCGRSVDEIFTISETKVY